MLTPPLQISPRSLLLTSLLSFCVAFASDAIPRSMHLDVGSGDGGARFTGFYRPTPLDGRMVRWTHGDGAIHLPAPHGVTGRVSVTLSRSEALEPTQVELRLSTCAPFRETVGPAFRRLDLPCVIRSPDQDITLNVSSASGLDRDGRQVGVAVSEVILRTGGLAGVLSPAVGRLLQQSLIALSLVLTVSLVTMRHGWGPLPAALTLVAVGVLLVLLRLSLAGWLPTLSRSSAGLLALLGLTSVPGLRTRVAALEARLAGRRLKTWHFGALAVLVAGWVFADVIAQGEILGQGYLVNLYEPWRAHAPDWDPSGNALLIDVPTQFYPFLTHARRVVRTLSVPLWSPASFTGHPFLAAFQTQVFAPFTLIGYALPIGLATITMAAARLLVGGLGMFALLRGIGLTGLASTFGGVGYLLNSFSVVWLEHPHAAVAAWFPWIVWAGDRVTRHGRARDVAVLGLMVGLAVLSGHPETAFKVLLVAFACQAILLGATRMRRRDGLLLVTGYAGGVALAAVQIVPFAEYLFESASFVARSRTEANPFFAPLQTVITAFVPDFLGHPIDGPSFDIRNRFNLRTNYHEQQVYAGVVTWLLAGIGVATKWSETRVRVFLGASLLGLALMYGVPGVYDLANVLPILRVTALSRFGLITIFGLVILGGYGLDSLVRAQPGTGKAPIARYWWPAAGMTVFIAAIALLFLHAPIVLLVGTQRTAAVNEAVVAVAVAIWGLGIILGRVLGGMSRTVCAVLLTGTLLVDLGGLAQGYHPGVRPELAFPTVPEIVVAQQDPGLFRVAGWGDALIPNTAMVYGLQDIRGYDAMEPVRYSSLLETAFGSQRIRGLDNLALLDLLNVKYLFGVPTAVRLPDNFVAADGVSSGLHVNTRVFSRAYLVDRSRVVESETEARALVARGGDELRGTVILEGALPPSDEPAIATSQEAIGSTGVETYADDRVVIETQSDGRRLLVLTDLHYPGWYATVDGQPVTIHRANYAFRAVSVPAGRHRVEFRYQPWSFRVGLAISLTALLIGLGAVMAQVGPRGWPPSRVARWTSFPTTGS